MKPSPTGREERHGTTNLFVVPTNVGSAGDLLLPVLAWRQVAAGRGDRVRLRPDADPSGAS